MVCDLCMSWVVSVPLLSMNGSPYDRIFPEPTPAAHTECRLRRAGSLIVAAEAGALPPVPAGLVNGTWWNGGTRPHLDPLRLIPALQALIREPALPDAALLQIVGRPVSLTDSKLTGDFDMLAQGRRTTLRESARITRRESDQSSASGAGPDDRTGSVVPDVVEGAGKPVELIVHAVPRRITAPELWYEIKDRVQRDDRHAQERRPGFPPTAKMLPSEATPSLPISEMHYESTENDLRLAIALRPEANFRSVVAQLADMDGLAVDMASEFTAPLAELLREWVITHRGEDISVSLGEFEAAVRADRLHDRAKRD